MKELYLSFSIHHFPHTTPACFPRLSFMHQQGVWRGEKHSLSCPAQSVDGIPRSLFLATRIQFTLVNTPTGMRSSMSLRPLYLLEAFVASSCALLGQGAGLGAHAGQPNASKSTYVTLPGDPLHATVYKLKNGLTVMLSVNKSATRIQ